MPRATTSRALQIGGRLPAVVVAAGVLAGCTSQPLLDERAQTPPLALVPVAYAGIDDGRGRFREILCRLSEHHGALLPDHRPCEEVLHELPGEIAPRDGRVNFGGSRSGLRLVIVPGQTAACPGELGRPLRLAARHLIGLGYRVDWIEVDGSSSSADNAASIRAAILAMPSSPDRPLVLLGYSKGTSDLLEALTDPEVAARVAAVVSLGGTVNGSPLADRASDAMPDALARLPGSQCQPGDRGGLASLRRGNRVDWLATRRLPATIRYYSLASFATRERISSILRPSYDALARIDPRNDGQLLFYDQILPASTLLGYLNADHWAIGLPIARDHPELAAQVDRNAFPRELVLEAIVKYVEDDLQGVGRDRSGDAPVITTDVPQRWTSAQAGGP